MSEPVYSGSGRDAEERLYATGDPIPANYRTRGSTGIKALAAAAVIGVLGGTAAIVARNGSGDADSPTPPDEPSIEKPTPALVYASEPTNDAKPKLPNPAGPDPWENSPVPQERVMKMYEKVRGEMKGPYARRKYVFDRVNGDEDAGIVFFKFKNPRGRDFINVTYIRRGNGWEFFGSSLNEGGISFGLLD